MNILCGSKFDRTTAGWEIEVRKPSQEQEREALTRAIEQANKFTKIDGPVEVPKTAINGGDFETLSSIRKGMFMHFDSLPYETRMHIKKEGD